MPWIRKIRDNSTTIHLRHSRPRWSLCHEAHMWGLEETAAPNHHLHTDVLILRKTCFPDDPFLQLLPIELFSSHEALHVWPHLFPVLRVSFLKAGPMCFYLSCDKCLKKNLTWSASFSGMHNYLSLSRVTYMLGISVPENYDGIRT